MSDQILSKLLENPVVLGIAVVVCIVLITIILRSRSENYSDEHIKEKFELETKNKLENDVISSFMNLPSIGTFEEVTHSGDIVENFPSTEMNVMYSDANGNLATTQDLGLKNLTVSGDSQFGDGKIGIKNGGTIYAPGRMHVHGEELLYLLHKNGVIIGKEWGGNGNLTVQGQANVVGNLVNNGQLNTDRMVVGGDLGAQFTGASINKGSGDWNTMIHNPTSAASVYMAHGGKYGMHINANNKDMDTYALQLYGGDKHLMQVTGKGHMYVAGQTNMDRLVVGGDLGGQFTGASINKGTGDWNTMIHNPTSAVSVLMAHGGKYGMHINANNKDMDTYALQLYGGDKHLMQVTGKGHMYVAGQTNMDRLVVGEDMNGAYKGMSMKKYSDDWMVRMDNAKNNANVHMCHGGGYGMHINAQNNGSTNYVLECHNGAKAVLTARGNGNVEVSDQLSAGSFSTGGQTTTGRLVVGGDTWGNGHGQGLMVRKADDGWQSLIHNIHNESNVHMAHGGGYGMHINAGSNNKNSDNYVLQCWNGEREVMQVNGKGNMFINGALLQDFIPITINFYGLKMDGTHFDGGGQNRTMVFGGHSTAFVCWLNGNDGNFNHIWAQMVARCVELGLNKACAKHAFDNLTPYSTLTMTIPPGKKVKIWGWDGQGASVYGPGYYCETLQRYPHFIWAGTDAREWDFNIVGSGSVKERTENRWNLFK